MMSRIGTARRRQLGAALLAVALVGVALPVAAGVAAASTSGAGHMTVNPIITSAGNASPSASTSYGLFGCQLGLDGPIVCYDPYQLRQAYDAASVISGGDTGFGKTIIIVDAFQSPDIVTELNTYDAFYGLPNLNGLGVGTNASWGTFTQIAPQGLTPFDPTNGNEVGWAQEISLDVESAHAMAPGANIVLDLSTDNSDTALQAALKYAVDHNLGDVISQSYGENENCGGAADTAAWHSIFADATLKNMTVFASSGDEGAANQTCDGSSWTQAVSSPASDPLVTGVGGTELHAAGYCLSVLGCDPSTAPAPGTYQGEIGWNEGPPFGDMQSDFSTTLSSGGGYSTVWSRPSYQASHNKVKARGVPDVAYSAAVLHGLLIFLDIPGVPVGFYLFGGTSCGSPQWAAITALADQAAGHDLGFLNSSLYKIAQSPPKYAADLHDVLTGTNSSSQLDALNNLVTVNGYNAGTEWDPVTGLGSPDVAQLIPALAQYYDSGAGTAEINQSKNG
jgi:subtilase family serine protease